MLSIPGLATSNLAREGICTTIGSGTGLRTARLAMNPRLTLIGDSGERGISPGTRLCSSGMTSSLGEDGEVRAFCGMWMPSALDKIGEMAAAVSVSSVGEPGIGAMLARNDRRGGGGRRPPALRVPRELTEEASESLLKREAGVTLRFCGRVERGRIAGMGGMLSCDGWRRLGRMGANGGGGNLGAEASERLLVPRDTSDSQGCFPLDPPKAPARP